MIPYTHIYSNVIINSANTNNIRKASFEKSTYSVPNCTLSVLHPLPVCLQRFKKKKKKELNQSNKILSNLRNKTCMSEIPWIHKAMTLKRELIERWHT